MPRHRHRTRVNPLLDHSVHGRARLHERWMLLPASRRWRRRVTVATAVAAVMVWGGHWWYHREQSAAFVLGVIKIGVNAPLGGAQLFPADNAWNTPIDSAPLHPLSDSYLATIGPETPLHPDFGQNLLGTRLYGIPYNVVDSAQTLRYRFRFQFAEASDPGTYPIPMGAAVEDGGDRHLIVLERETMRLYEIYRVGDGTGALSAGSGAIFDLRSNELRPEGWTSTDAAGLPILPGLVRADEVYGLGEIRHALRFTLPRTQRAYVHPARHSASRDTNPALPPMGLRLRLKASANLDGLPPGAHVIATALQKYGMILADNGSPLYLTGTADRRWKRRDTEALKRFVAGDFEVVVSGGS